MEQLMKTVERLMEGVWRKTTVLGRSAVLTGRPTVLPWDRTAVHQLTSCWKTADETEEANVPFVFTSAKERDWCERIRKETTVWNRNNVTRTQAYWNLYREFPELHWALLAHLVSRNGGWSMTDLKGQWLPRLLSSEDARADFRLLEMCNALIFRDAYPQLKLYAESRQKGQALFHFLPYFKVSGFMLPLWEWFWKHQDDSPLLTVGLIVNEQHVIEEPVVENYAVRTRVFDSLSFRSQPLLQTNQVVFPVLHDNGQRGHHPLRLAGRVLERFDDLQERIQFGKCLYALLFGYPKILSGAGAFAQKVPHTGSRSDYWSDRFYPLKRKTGGKPDERELSAAESWYSPPLEAAWPDQPLPSAAPKDWFTDRSVLSYLTAPRPPRIVDMTFEHLHGQRKLQAAAELAHSSKSH
ncbi:MAG: hypothetical protein JWR03_2908 [Cohnella sp.]|nr:hypothetical protein [Cohnella sp.]